MMSTVARLVVACALGTGAVGTAAAMPAATAEPQPWASPRPPWLDEHTVQVPSLASGGLPAVGGGPFRRLSRILYVGGRVMVPLAGEVGLSGELATRAYFSPQPTSFFVEGELSGHLVHGFDSFLPAAGVLFGGRAWLGGPISVGGAFGPLVYPTAHEPVGVVALRVGPVGIVPRMLASLELHL